MKKILVVVDMQKDFVDGTLGSEYAVAIVPNVVRKIESFEGDIVVTYDTHSENYMNTREGRKLPVSHCIKGTEGWKLNDKVYEALSTKKYIELEKETFGSVKLPDVIKELAAGDEFGVELIGLCTDICVVSNAILLKAHYPEVEISVDASCCAGVTVETHNAALETMKCCQIDVFS